MRGSVRRTVIVLHAFACASTRACGRTVFFQPRAPHLSRASHLSIPGLLSACAPANVAACPLARFHPHTSDRAMGGLFYIKQYGNTPTGRKMSNKDTRALPCYYAITYHPFLRPLFNPLVAEKKRERESARAHPRSTSTSIPRTVGYT